MKVKIKEAQKFENKELAEFCREIFGALDKYVDCNYFSQFGYKFYVARDKKNKIVGICGAKKKSDGSFELTEFAVSKEQVGTSLSDALLQAVMSKIPQNSVVNFYAPAEENRCYYDRVMTQNGFSTQDKITRKISKQHLDKSPFYQVYRN